MDRACRELSEKVQRFATELGDVFAPEVLGKEAAFQFLYGLLNYGSPQRAAARLRYDHFIDFQLTDSPLECHREHLRVGDEFVQVLTLKEPPAQTMANLLKGLTGLSCNLIAVTEWKPTNNAAMRRVVRSKQRHFFNSQVSAMNYVTSAGATPQEMLVDQSAAALVRDLGGCLEEMELKGRRFGEFSLTLVVRETDPVRLRRAVSECFKVCATLDLTLIEERYNQLNAFLAILPGNDAFNLRRLRLMDVNYADCSFLFAPHAGEVRNAALDTEHLAVLETNQGTPFFFNLHHGDVGHTLILGGTGSGKSFTLNFLITHAQKYAPYTFICDVGGSYADLTRSFKGTYVPVGLEKRSFTINPFSLAPIPENLRFLLIFLRVLIESGGYVMTAADERDLHEQIENLYAVEPSQRRLLTLANILSRPLREQLGRWVQGGPHASLFDNVEDNLTFARFQTFDFEGMSRVPQLLEPLLFYVLHRANAVIYDPAAATTFKLFVVDEAWRLLRHPAIRLYVQEGLKTWRKKNAAMILATQSGDDLLQSEMLPIVVESCPTKLFLANPGMDARAYREAFHLNETEASLIAGLIPKQQILIQRPDRSKVVNLKVDPKGYWLYSNTPFDNQKKREAFAQYGFDEGLDILARSNS